MSPCSECPLLAAHPKIDPLAERRAYAAARREEAVDAAASAIIAVYGWADVKARDGAKITDVGAWAPPWARTAEGRKARVEEIAAGLRADYGEKAVELLRAEVDTRRKALKGIA